jgi:hypothetical protein
MPRMWSAAARTDGNRVSDRNTQRGHNHRIRDPFEQRLNLVRVGFLVQPSGLAGRFPRPPCECVPPLRLRKAPSVRQRARKTRIGRIRAVGTVGVGLEGGLSAIVLGVLGATEGSTVRLELRHLVITLLFSTRILLRQHQLNGRGRQRVLRVLIHKCDELLNEGHG